MGRIGALLTPFVAQVMADVWISTPMLIYGFSAMIAAVLAIFLPIETKGQRLKVLTKLNRKYLLLYKIYFRIIFPSENQCKVLQLFQMFFY